METTPFDQRVRSSGACSQRRSARSPPATGSPRSGEEPSKLRLRACDGVVCVQSPKLLPTGTGHKHRRCRNKLNPIIEVRSAPLRTSKGMRHFSANFTWVASRGREWSGICDLNTSLHSDNSAPLGIQCSAMQTFENRVRNTQERASATEESNPALIKDDANDVSVSEPARQLFCDRNARHVSDLHSLFEDKRPAEA